VKQVGEWFRDRNTGRWPVRPAGILPAAAFTRVFSEVKLRCAHRLESLCSSAHRRGESKRNIRITSRAPGHFAVIDALAPLLFRDLSTLINRDLPFATALNKNIEPSILAGDVLTLIGAFIVGAIDHHSHVWIGDLDFNIG
jgi:hypothetical protein